MMASVKVCKYFLSLIDISTEFELAKEWLVNQLKSFMKTKILEPGKEIVNHGLNLINDGDTIVTYSCSGVVKKLLVTAKEKGKNFSVLVIENPPLFEGRQTIAELSKLGIPCTITLLGCLPSLVSSKNHKIFVGASIITNNGMLVSRVGTSTVENLSVKLACLLS